jgi:predicted metalloprotease
MRWTGRRQSGNVEDRRGAGGRGMAVGGGAVGIIVLLVALLFGVNPGDILNRSSQGFGSGGQVSTTFSAQEEQLKEFVSVVLADTEDVWTTQFEQMGMTYRQPRLVLFSGTVDTPTGVASAATGPFYSPEDETIYLDLSFYDELSSRFGAPGDFAQAYVLAHEVGHHVQRQLGILDEVGALQRGASETQANDLSVRLELQADFLAGVWAHYAQEYLQVLDPGDIDEALTAASAIGDDRLQMEAQGYVVPDSFTHGTAEQRARWFRLGFETGDVSQGDTFSSVRL